jgi:hypothetical protein
MPAWTVHDEEAIMDDLTTKQEILKFTQALRTAGIRSISVSYSGSGDEGQTEAPQFENAEGAPIALPDSDNSLDVDTLGDLFSNFVPEGYQDGDGGWGEITFDVETGKIRMQHYWYETVSNPDEPREI